MASTKQGGVTDQGESSKRLTAVMSRMPLVDLTSLAPEDQQGVGQVKQGWKETTDSLQTNIKNVAQKIHGMVKLHHNNQGTLTYILIFVIRLKIKSTQVR